MMHPELQIDAHTLEPLLKPHILKDLKETYVKTAFPPGEKKATWLAESIEKSNVIGWRQTLITSPANHIHFLLIRAQKNRQVGNSLKQT